MMALNNKDQDVLDMFAAHALSGYVRDGLSLTNHSKDECNDIAEGCYELATSMLLVRSRVRDTIETL